MNDDTNFALLKKQGIDGVVIKATDRICENIQKARSENMNVMVQLFPNAIKNEKVLYSYAGRIAVKDGEIKYTSADGLKTILAKIGSLTDEIDAFIIPAPEISGPLWSEKLAGMCKMEEEGDPVLYELFDSEVEKSPVRSWYYTNLQKYILKKYIMPIKRLAQKYEKEIICDLGKAEMQYDLMPKMINPLVLKESGLLLLLHKESDFSGKDFTISENYIERAEETDEDAKILLIKPTRGVMERFIQGEIKTKPNRLETPALLSAIEGVYYCDMLSQKGYLFDIRDEFFFATKKDCSNYEHILISKSCLFKETETKRLDKLKKAGIKINDKDLICDLTQKGED